jgi:hypothetical protein
MEKFILYITIIFSLFLVGCTTDLPPEPDAVGAPIGEAIGYYQGYGPHYDVFNDDRDIFLLENSVFNLEPEEESLRLGMGVDHQGGFIYRYGYFYTDGGWELYQFPENTVSGSNWIKNSAETSIEVNTHDITPGENYVVSYSCKKYDGTWRCGCSSQNGACNQWMLQTYLYRNVDLPPEPIPPGGLITTRVYISPSGKLLRQDNNVDLYVSFQSTKDILNDIDEEIGVRVTNPDGVQEWAEISRFGDVKCNECEGNECREQFSCQSSYGTTISPSILGDYLLDLGDVEEFPEWMKVETGSFKIVNDEFFSERLIEEDIGSLLHIHSGGWFSSSGNTVYAHYRGDGTFLSASVDSRDSVFGAFERIKNNPDYYPEDFDGSLIYVRELESYTPYYRERVDRIQVVWLSGNNLISVYMRGPNLDVEDFLEAYLEKHPANGEITCTDSDGGENIYQKGEVTSIQNGVEHLSKDECFIYYDVEDQDGDFGEVVSECSGDKCKLWEQICINGNTAASQKEVICPLGCFNGACVSETTGKLGEAWRVVGISNNKLEISENLIDGTNRESIGSIFTEVSGTTGVGMAISEVHLPNILAEGTVTNSKGEFHYHQDLQFNGGDTGFVQLLENDEDITTYFLYFKNEKRIASYRLGFSNDLESDVVEDSNLISLEGSTIRILGNTYKITQANKRGNDGIELVLQGDGKLVLRDTNIQDSQSSDTLIANDQTIDGANVIIQGNVNSIPARIKTLEIEMVAQDDLYVNGKLSEQLDQPDLLFTGSWDIEYKGNSDSEITNNIDILTSGTRNYNLRYTDTAGNGVNLPLIHALQTLESAEISKGDTFVLGGFTVEYTGAERVTSTSPHLLKFKINGDPIQFEYDSITGNLQKISTLSIGGDGYDIYSSASYMETDDFNIVVDKNADGIIDFKNFKLGNDNNDLILNENQILSKDDYFILASHAIDAETNIRSSFALQYKGADKSSIDNSVIKFKNLGDNEPIEYPVIDGTSSINIGGGIYKIRSASPIDVNDFSIQIDLNGDGFIGEEIVSIGTQYGAEISIEDDTNEFIRVAIGTSSGHYEDLVPTPFIFYLFASDGQVDMVRFLNHKFLTPDGSEASYAISSYGAVAEYLQQDGPTTSEIDYPKNQVFPNVFITGEYGIPSEEVVEESAEVITPIETE